MLNPSTPELALCSNSTAQDHLAFRGRQTRTLRSRILRSMAKAPAQRLADRAAHYLTLVAVGSGLVTFVVWQLIAQQPLLVAVTFAVTAVVIACPDALGLATPTAVMVATDLAAKRGVLFKEAKSLELASRIQASRFTR